MNWQAISAVGQIVGAVGLARAAAPPSLYREREDVREGAKN
jgi:hypothetical protein